MIIHKQEIGAQAPVKSHCFKLALTQTPSSNDKLVDVNLNDFSLKVDSQPSRFRLADYGALLEDSNRNSHFLEKLIEERKGIARGECHECGRIGYDQHQALARKAASSESRSSAG